MSQAGLCGQAGQLDLPGPDPVAVGSAGIGGDQEPVGVGEAGSAHLVPPASDGLDGELGGVGGVADVDPALVVGHVVDPVGDGLGVLAQGGIGEVVDVDPLGFALAVPIRPRRWRSRRSAPSSWCRR